jgi:hypothetical protein
VQRAPNDGEDGVNAINNEANRDAFEKLKPYSRKTLHYSRLRKGIAGMSRQTLE